jgi:hypothetical protein
MGHCDFLIDLILPAYGSGVDSASDRNEFLGYFLGAKGGRCVRLKTLRTFMCRLSRNSESLNLKETYIYK